MAAVEEHHRVVGFDVDRKGDAIPAGNVQFQLGEPIPRYQLLAHRQISDRLSNPLGMVH